MLKIATDAVNTHAEQLIDSQVLHSPRDVAHSAGGFFCYFAAGMALQFPAYRAAMHFRVTLASHLSW